MISFEQVLERAGFERISEYSDVLHSQWRQRDAEGRATIAAVTDLPLRPPLLIVNISPDNKTAVYVGTWDNPIVASLELPRRLKQVYQELK